MHYNKQWTPLLVSVDVVVWGALSPPISGGSLVNLQTVNNSDTLYPKDANIAVDQTTDRRN